MDTLTHALSGALFARATSQSAAQRGAIARRVAAGFFACAAPDLDFVIGFFGPVKYLQFHRGVTHSLLMLPLWALVLSWVLAKLLREPGGWRALYGVCALALGTTFIIDLWFTGIIVVGLVAAALFRRTRLPAVIASIVLVGYVGFQWVQKQRAEEIGARYAVTHGLADASVTALPRPLSPFNWTVFVSDDRAHHFAHVNLVREQPLMLAPDAGLLARLDAAYLPVAQAHWETRSRYGDAAQTEKLARDAWNAPSLAFFRWFADKPAFDGITHGSTCVWFEDLRFLTPGRGNVPFRYGVCRDVDQAPWRAYQRAGPTGRTQVERLD